MIWHWVTKWGELFRIYLVLSYINSIELAWAKMILWGKCIFHKIPKGTWLLNSQEKKNKLNLGLKHHEDSVCLHLYVCVSVMVLLVSVYELHFSLSLGITFLQVMINMAINSSIAFYLVTQASRLAQHPLRYKVKTSEISIGIDLVHLWTSQM